MTFRNSLLTAAILAAASGAAFAAGHATAPMVEAGDQSVANGVVSADRIIAGETGWLVVHRTDAQMTPGAVVGHAPLREGENIDVVAILTEAVTSGEMLMLMVHSEAGGMQAGIFEYTLGAKEDGPIRIDDQLVMSIITTQ